MGEPTPDARERPILFSGPMVRALLAGRKTQTRRAIKPQPPAEAADAGVFSAPRKPHDNEWQWLDSADLECASPIGEGFRCRYGVPDDRLWIKETWSPSDTPTGAAYAADCDPRQDLRGMGWRPSIHMPRWASRITLQITDVRVERVQAISEADAIAEGLYRSQPDDEDRNWYRDTCEERGEEPDWAEFNAGVWMAPGAPQRWGLTKVERRRDRWGPTARFAFRLVWESLHGPASWEANPWVWAITFERVAKASPTERGAS